MEDMILDAGVLAAVNSIKLNALNNTLANGVPRKLTDQQALNIYVRSYQLARDSFLHPTTINQNDLRRQINYCYEHKRA